MANCSDNSYVISYTTESKPKIQIPRSSLDTTTLDIALLGKTRLEYGKFLNENLLHLMENFASPEDPNNIGNPDFTRTYSNLLEHPTVGQLWYNSTQRRLYVYGTNLKWIPLLSINSISGNSGTILDGQQIPLPTTIFNEIVPLKFCSWVATPFHVPEDADVIICNTDINAVVNMKYRLVGSTQFVSGIANYMIIGILDNKNVGTNVCTETLTAMFNLESNQLS